MLIYQFLKLDTPSKHIGFTNKVHAEKSSNRKSFECKSFYEQHFIILQYLQYSSVSQFVLLKSKEILHILHYCWSNNSKCKSNLFCGWMSLPYIKISWCWSSSGTKHMENTKEIMENTKEIGHF